MANFPPDVGYAWWLMENYWTLIARHCASRGRRCLLAYPQAGEPPPAIRDAPIEVVELDYADRSPAGLARLEAFVREHGVTSLYLTDQPLLDAMYGRLRRWGVQRIVVHDHVPGERPPASPARRLFKQLLARSDRFRADRYIGVSRFVERRCREVGCLPAARCTHVYNGVVPIRRAPGGQDYAARTFGLPHDREIVVSTGRATWYKGIDFLIHCAERLQSLGPRAPVFLHVGDGPDLETFRASVREAGLAGRFLFAGRRGDVRAILPSCDIALHASHGEAFSLSILEYMSAGLATVTPDHCGNAEAIRDGVDGILYRPGDLDQAVAALRELLADRPRRERLARAAMRRVDECFTLEHANRAFLDEIAGVL